jgi:Tat protein secretion system quality control protein TatD with DNase activity
LVAGKVAELKGINLEDLKPIVWENSIRCFPKLKG